jgi:V8-like Glu-specific endopeptidase
VPGEGVTESGLRDAWDGSYTPLTRLLKPGGEPQAVIAGLPRWLVGRTSDYPWCCVCSLLITDNASGQNWMGSGWLAGPRTVITAGHCVYLQKHVGWARQVEVFPGRNGEASPQSYLSADLRSVAGWTEQRIEACDYGAVILPRPVALPNHFDFRPLTNDDLKAILVNVFGYPGEKARGTMWGHWGQVTDVRPQRLRYLVSTSPGQSGCPVWVKSGQQRYVVGIHNYAGEDGTGNFGTRVTQEVWNNICAWLSP